jgi:hypothetical protein
VVINSGRETSYWKVRPQVRRTLRNYALVPFPHILSLFLRVTLFPTISWVADINSVMRSEVTEETSETGTEMFLILF